MEKPILFNTEMVQAIIGEKKTITRRIIKRTPSNDDPCGYGFWKELNGLDGRWYIKDYTHAAIWWTLEEYISRFSKYQASDIVWVREPWALALDTFAYKADYSEDVLNESKNKGLWKSSIHMPRAAARLFLKIVDIKIERLQDITEEDILMEGIPYDKETYETPCNIDNAGETYLRGCFMRAWNSTIAKKDIGMNDWNSNPWVFVIEFERVKL